jgi:hypothetical protein
MRLSSSKRILTGACVSFLMLGMTGIANAAPKNSTPNQPLIMAADDVEELEDFEVVGYVRSIIGSVVTIEVEDMEVVGVPGIEANDGEPTFVTIPEAARGKIHTLYLTHETRGITGLVPGHRVYVSVSSQDGNPCIDYMKVIPNVNYEKVEAPRLEFPESTVPSIELPEVSAPSPVERPIAPPPAPELPPAPPAPIPGLW